MRNLLNRVAVVTGAGGGIGLAVARQLAAAGCRLALVDVDAARLAQAARSFSPGRGDVSTHVVDVAQRAPMQALADEVAARHGRVNVLVNNAGVSLAGPFEELPLDDLEWIVGVNFLGAVHGCKFFLPYLRQADVAHIVNVSSGFGLIGFPTKSGYCASKFALRGFHDALAAELHASHIGLTIVYPPAVDTGIVARGRAVDPRKQQIEAQFVRRRGMPVERVATRIVAGLRRGQRRVVIGADTRLLDLAARLAPNLTARLIARFQRRIPFV